MELRNTYLLVKRSLLVGVACFLLLQTAYCAEVDSTYQFYLHGLDPATPDLEYYSHQIDDDQMAPSSGDNDGLAEPGESIELYLSLRNTGTGDAHNVSASLSTSNSSINITNAGSTFGDIPSTTSDQSSGAYGLDIATDCREGEVNFVLNITSDEGSWTDQFQLHVYATPNSISDELFSAAIELYPNPAGKALFLKSTIEIDTPLEIRILESRGATLFMQDVPSIIKGEIIELDLSELDPGIYFVHLRHEDLSESRKIVIE